MASLTQGAALPDVTTTQQTTSTAPAWYNNFLSGISTTGAQTPDTGVAGFSGLQQQAFGNAPGAINAGQGAMGTAVNTATNVANTPTTDMISQYMNPYTSSVVDELGRLGQQNWENKIAPGATAGAVGSGQFGSTRGMNVYGNLARETNRDITGQQGALLQSGFDNALKAAQNQQTLGLQSAQTLGTLGNQQYTQGVGGLDVLSKLGAQQQAQEQAKIDYPLSLQERQATTLKGLQVPMSTAQTFKGPIPGAYSASPLQQILGYTAGTASLFTPKFDSKGNPIPGTSPLSQIPGLNQLLNLGSGSNTPTTPTPTDPFGANGSGYGQTSANGWYTDASGIPYPPGTQTDALGNDISQYTGGSAQTGYDQQNSVLNNNDWML